MFLNAQGSIVGSFGQVPYGRISSSAASSIIVPAGFHQGRRAGSVCGGDDWTNGVPGHGHPHPMNTNIESVVSGWVSSVALRSDGTAFAFGLDCAGGAIQDQTMWGNANPFGVSGNDRQCSV